jgi:hypothetical protein
MHGGRTTPKDLAMIVVCPTKALQQDMVSSILYLLVLLLCLCEVIRLVTGYTLYVLVAVPFPSALPPLTKLVIVHSRTDQKRSE